MKQPLVLGALLGAALVGSYLTWTDDGEEGANATDVVVLRATPDTLDRIVWTDAGKTITVARQSDELGRWLAVEEVDQPTAPAPAEDTDAVDPMVEGTAGQEPTPEPAGEPEVTRFTGNEQADDIWEAFAPLYALRELTLGGEATLESFGLDAPETTLQVTTGGRTVAIELGGEAYGTRDRYVRADGKVYLLEDKTIRPLEFAKTRLVERRLFPLEEKAIAGVDVQRGADARSFTQRNADDRTRAFWADATSADTKDVEAGTWLGKLFRMRVRSYVDPADIEGTPRPVLAFVVRGTDGVAWPVRVVEVGEGATSTYYAEAGFLRATVELTRSLAEEVVADLESLFDGITPEAPAEEEEEEEEAVDD
ncbi:MAG: DUF4340 domain-containing protein, partial [Alphaproteobacteria bacterium]|nr:DUF4340 domain-containing protein [Alphaproteobacteria bacterium]